MNVVGLIRNVKCKGTNNITFDPMFVDTTSSDPNLWDYHFLLESLCIDAGDNLVVDPNSTDLDGNDRIIDGDEGGESVVDMGAYEFDWLYLGDFAGGCDVDWRDFSVLMGSWQMDDPSIDIAPYLEPDGVIDLGELLLLATHWLEQNIIADFTKDGRVDLQDLAILHQYWLQDNPSTDIAPFGNADGVIDLGELLLLAAHWLEGTF